MSRELKIATVAFLTLPVSLLWKLHPHAYLPFDQVPWFELFPYSETKITWPTYVSMICNNAIKLMWIYVIWELLPGFRWSLNTWFVIQALQFVEFFFTYNETQIFVKFMGHNVEIGLHLAKLIIPWLVFIFEATWKK